MSNALIARLPSPWPPHAPIGCRDPSIIEGYLSDVSRLKGRAEVLYRPRDTDEVAAILHHADQTGMPLTVAAEQTSTTGSSVPMGGAVLSMEKLCDVQGMTKGKARAQAGIVLGRFQEILEAQGYFYPPDPTSRHECTLGASVACNASGARTFKYGPTRPYVMGLTVVIPGGYILDLRRGEVWSNARHEIELILPRGSRRTIPMPRHHMPRVKHAAGYHCAEPMDAIDLFIGSEGTLGVITEVEVKTIDPPRKVLSLLAGWSDPAALIRFVRHVRDSNIVNPRCLEYFDSHSIRIMREISPQALSASAQAALFFEEECCEDDVDARLDTWYDLLVAHDALTDDPQGVIVADNAPRQELLYSLRHAVPAGVNEKAAAHGMPKIGTDLAVPDSALEPMMASYQSATTDVLAFLGLEEGTRTLEAALGEHERRELDPDLLPDRIRSAMEEGASTRALELLSTAWKACGLPFAFEHALFGHIGDNHLHLNFLPRTQKELVVAQRVYRQLTRKAIDFGGTASAEHGIGKTKRWALEMLFSKEEIERMMETKKALDPRAILGRGTLFEAG